MSSPVSRGTQIEGLQDAADPQPIPIGPHDGLIIVDVQNDFCPGGALSVPHGDQVVSAINQTQELFGFVVATQDWHPLNHCSFQSHGGVWPYHCVANTPGADLRPDLHTAHITARIKKGTSPDRDAYSGFSGTELDSLLRQHGIRRLFVVGLATDYCVRATALDALQAGYQVVVLVDAVRGVDVHEGDSERALGEIVAAGGALAATGQLRRS